MKTQGSGIKSQHHSILQDHNKFPAKIPHTQLPLFSGHAFPGRLPVTMVGKPEQPPGPGRRDRASSKTQNRQRSAGCRNSPTDSPTMVSIDEYVFTFHRGSNAKTPAKYDFTPAEYINIVRRARDTPPSQRQPKSGDFLQPENHMLDRGFAGEEEADFATTNRARCERPGRITGAFCIRSPRREDETYRQDDKHKHYRRSHLPFPKTGQVLPQL